MTQLTPEAAADFIERALDWPYMPWLPVKRLSADGFLETGVMWAMDVAEAQMNQAGAKYRVFAVAFSRLHEHGTRDHKNAVQVEVASLPLHGSYDSAEAAVADGWVPD